MGGNEIKFTRAWPKPHLLLGGLSYQSQSEDITDYSSINVNLIVTGSSNTETLTVEVEQTYDPGVPGSWTTITQLQLLYTTGTAVIHKVHDCSAIPGLGPYIRINASLSGGSDTWKAFLVKAVVRE